MRSARTMGGLRLVKAAAIYSNVKWAFANPYRGSELTLKILAPGGFTPGPWYDDRLARNVLGPLIETARASCEVTDTALAGLAFACLCTTPTSADGSWLAELLSGDSKQPDARPTIGGLLWQFGRMTAVATSIGPVTQAAVDRAGLALSNHPRAEQERFERALTRPNGPTPYVRTMSSSPSVCR